MRTYIIGQKAFGEAVLQMCLDDGHNVAGVSSPPGKDRPDRLRALAWSTGVAWTPTSGLQAEGIPAGVEVILAAHAHCFIDRELRRCALHGALGYHPSLLPLHRGRDAIRWALRMHEPVTGGTVFWLDDGADTGPIAAQDWCFVMPGESPMELWKRALFPMGIRLLSRVLGEVERGVVTAVPQDESLATWEPAFKAPPLRASDSLKKND